MTDCVYDISSFTEEELVDQARHFLIEKHYEDLWNAMQGQDLVWQSLTIRTHENLTQFLPSFMDMLNENPILGNLLLHYPKHMTNIFDQGILDAQEDIQRRLPDEEIFIKYRIVIRWCRLPLNPEVYRTTIPKSNDADKMITIRGTVVRAHEPKTIEWEIEYKCSACGGRFLTYADLESYNHHPYPTECKALRDPGSVGPKKACNSKKFEKVSVVSSYNTRDYQDLKLQEQVHQLGMGAMPRSIIVVVMDELAGKCNPGDDATITGILTHRWGILQAGEKPEIELILLASHISINNERQNGSGVTDELRNEFENFWRINSSTPLKARDAIIKSICPEVYGMFYVKLAIGIVVAGGVAAGDEKDAIRGDPHLLMVGDPGTGKSQLLRFASKMANRSVLTTGTGTTGAGLTAAAVREQGQAEWALEAGALVLADGGLCCIDEFSSIKNSDLTALHQAMEQQSINMAKASLVCQLHTRCSIIAATNPKGKYNMDSTVSMNTALESPLLSRFDLVLVLLDEPNHEWDHMVASFILHDRAMGLQREANLDIDDPLDNPPNDSMMNNQLLQTISKSNPSISKSNNNIRHQIESKIQHGNDTSPNNKGKSQFGELLEMDSLGVDDSVSSNNSQTPSTDNSAAKRQQAIQMLGEIWPIPKLQAYIAWVKSNFRPHISPACQTIAKAYYRRHRSSDEQDQARTTTRLLRSLVRIMQGHARLMARHATIVKDAIFAICLMESSSTSTSCIGGSPIPAVRSFFADDPDSEYLQTEKKILRALGLAHLSPNLANLSLNHTQQEKPERITGDEFYVMPPQPARSMSGFSNISSHLVPSNNNSTVNSNDDTESSSEDMPPSLSQHSAWSQKHNPNHNIKLPSHNRIPFNLFSVDTTKSNHMSLFDLDQEESEAPSSLGPDL